MQGCQEAAATGAAPAARTDARQTLAVFGHAVYNPSLTLLLATLRGLAEAEKEKIMQCNTQEACGYLVKADAVELLLTEADTV